MDHLDLKPEQELPRLVEDLNEKLRATGAGSAELALGLLIRLGFLPVLVIVLLLFLFKVINIILGFVILVIVSLVLLGVSMLISERARQNAMQQVYRSEVETAIDQFTHESSMTRHQFDTLAYSLLPANAPLLHFLSPATGVLLEPTREDENQEKE